MSKFDEEFEKWSLHVFRNQPYPVDAYTFFGAGWKAAMAAAAEIAEREQGSLRNGGAINAAKSIARKCREA